MLNKLPDMSDSRHLKIRSVQITIKLLKVKYGPEATSLLRSNKHTGKEIITTRRWFNCSIRKQSIHLLLKNGMMSCNHLHIELLEVTEQGKVWPKLKMVTLNHIKHKPVRSKASPLIQKMGKHTNLKKCKWRPWGCYRLWHIRIANPHGPLSS